MLFVDPLALEVFMKNGERPMRALCIDADVLTEHEHAPVFIALCSRTQAHWSLLVLCGEHRRFAVHLDSCAGKNDELARRALLALHDRCALVFWPTSYAVQMVTLESTPQQSAAWECGYCVGVFAACVVRVVRDVGAEHFHPAMLFRDDGAHSLAQQCQSLARTLLAWHGACADADAYEQQRLRHLVSIK